MSASRKAKSGESAEIIVWSAGLEDFKAVRAWSDIMGESSGLAFDDISLSLAVSADEAALEAKKSALAPAAVVTPAMGASAPLEWWHHEAPPETVTNGLAQGGLGFKRIDIVRRPSANAPENWSGIPDGG